MTFVEELEKVRRFLRDPDGLIWTDGDVLVYYNDALLEIASKIGFVEKVHSYKYPPEWTFSFFYDWERQSLDGDLYQCLTIWQARNIVVAYPWEAVYWLTNSDTPDGGTRFIHPWESAYASPADYIPLPFHAKFHKARYVAYNERSLSPTTQGELSDKDSHYRTASGTPGWYWRPDIEGNQIVLYPRPSSVTFDDGGLLREPTEALADDGGLNTWQEDSLDETDTGIIIDNIDTANALFMVFEAIPNEVYDDVGDWHTEQIDFPEMFLKYVRYGCLERCFGADNDGFIPSLRDFWRMRKEIGIKAIKRFKVARLADRTFQLGGSRGRVQSSHPRLPAEYPVQAV